MGIWVALGAVVLVAAWLYNTLVSRKNGVDYAFGGIDAMLKKRYDLIPNLVAAVQGAMQFERDLLERLTQLRSQALGASADQAVALDKDVTGLLRGLRVAVENYPDLKSSTNVLHLQATLHDLEEHIAAARRAYNSAVTDYNNAVEMFPTNLAARLMGYTRKALFEIPPDERAPVPVRDLLPR